LKSGLTIVPNLYCLKYFGTIEGGGSFVETLRVLKCRIYCAILVLIPLKIHGTIWVQKGGSNSINYHTAQVPQLIVQGPLFSTILRPDRSQQLYPYPVKSILSIRDCQYKESHTMLTTSSSEGHRSKMSKLSNTSVLASLLLISLFLCQGAVVVATSAVDGNDEYDPEEAMRLAREQAKPWLMREFYIFGYRTLVSPATIFAISVFVINIVYALSYRTSGTWAEVSHILIKDTSNKKTFNALVDMQKQIGPNMKLFGETAEKYSQCPSKNALGDLGRFTRGDMTPPFDRVVFDPASPTEMTLGPIETQFGYHLIYIRKRKL
jgi:peptidyl-prolyl cis-trans isomerase C